jgi:ribonuclease HI
MKYYTDGFVIGHNPSDIGGGYTITDDRGLVLKQEHIYKKKFTNNEGEMLGVIETLRLARKGDSISTDSMCILSWINKGSSKARPDFNILLKEARKLKEDKEINLMWEGRDFNLAGQVNEDKDMDRKYDNAYEQMNFLKNL